ncbi:chemotaxis protein CheW [Massilia sp. Leaf139]|uniref:chemotaxis protein CheW n=1 Tax=Massilia sp. Leaf139 TaxID=1736272 RepID=UPI0006FD18E1|nr:chemotaxis protein CheW [Massilia sp. Leaf139]KQQ87465.1 type IV pili signal transduction protein [Massilia sp. Leaf139]
MHAEAGALAPQANRRTRLSDYQAQLLARMQAAQNGAPQAQHQLGVAIGGERYLLELTEAGEIVPPGLLVGVPLTQPWYLGLANVRGSLLGVIDLARYVDCAASAAGPEARLVSLAPRLGFNCALLVTRVYGLRRPSTMESVNGRLHDADGQAWTPLSLAALVREERFLHVALQPR